MNILKELENKVETLKEICADGNLKRLIDSKKQWYGYPKGSVGDAICTYYSELISMRVEVVESLKEEINELDDRHESYQDFQKVCPPEEKELLEIVSDMSKEKIDAMYGIVARVGIDDIKILLDVGTNNDK